MTTENFEGWAILELMGHRRLAGFISEATVAGAALLRIDVHQETEPVATQYYSSAAIYCITPTTEELAKKFTAHFKPAPVQRWELPEPANPRGPEPDEDDDEVEPEYMRERTGGDELPI